MNHIKKQLSLVRKELEIISLKLDDDLPKFGKISFTFFEKKFIFVVLSCGEFYFVFDEDNKRNNYICKKDKSILLKFNKTINYPFLCIPHFLNGNENIISFSDFLYFPKYNKYIQCNRINKQIEKSNKVVILLDKFCFVPSIRFYVKEKFEFPSNDEDHIIFKKNITTIGNMKNKKYHLLVLNFNLFPYIEDEFKLHKKSKNEVLEIIRSSEKCRENLKNYKKLLRLETNI